MFDFFFFLWSHTPLRVLTISFILFFEIPKTKTTAHIHLSRHSKLINGDANVVADVGGDNKILNSGSKRKRQSTKKHTDKDDNWNSELESELEHDGASSDEEIEPVEVAI